MASPHDDVSSLYRAAGDVNRQSCLAENCEYSWLDRDELLGAASSARVIEVTSQLLVESIDRAVCETASTVGLENHPSGSISSLALKWGF
jgi:hypothetical protein